MKLKVKTKFFDREKEEYIDPKETEMIERDKERALQLIKKGVCEEYQDSPKEKVAEAEKPLKKEE